MGYRRRGGIFRHPERTAVFVGDLIDRGPRIREVLAIARPMAEEGSARIVMGNHELNALAFHTPDPAIPGEYLRVRSEKHVRLHEETVRQLGREMRSALEWFWTLPLWLDLGGIRVVHACWDAREMRFAERYLRRRRLTKRALVLASDKRTRLHQAIEIISKGQEILLPRGVSFRDKGGVERFEMRTRWYLDSRGHTYRSYSFPLYRNLPAKRLRARLSEGYPAGAPPVFFGHYWLPPRRPKLLAPNVCCLDYSIAKDGFLCAYRWQGEARLSERNFVRS